MGAAAATASVSGAEVGAASASRAGAATAAVARTGAAAGGMALPLKPDMDGCWSVSGGKLIRRPWYADHSLANHPRSSCAA